MDAAEKVDLVSRPPTEEVVTLEELLVLFLPFQSQSTTSALKFLGSCI